MAYNYLGLVNDVNRRINEVELTSSNFSAAIGSYSAIKDAVNSAIRYINQHEFQWPFNHVDQEETIIAGTVRYAFPADCKTLDLNSFRLKRDSTLGNATKRLKILSYGEYLDTHIDMEYDSSTTQSWQISWNETGYQADNTKGWEAFKSNDTEETKTMFDWNGSAWVGR